MSKQPRYQEPLQVGPLRLRFPRTEDLDQDEEWCELEVDGEWKRIRFHDYGDVYAVPGLYEALFCRLLRCVSPQVVPRLLSEMVAERGETMRDLRVFDIGAGNGLAGESLQYLGTPYIVGNDIFPEAKTATERDRPWAYEAYHIFDLTDPSADVMRRLEAANFNALTAVGALGFGDIPPKALQTAYNLVEKDGWVAFNIHERFLTDPQATGFAGLIRRMVENDVMQMELYRRYQHRISIAGEPLFYIAAVARKRAEIPDAMVAEVD